MAHITYFSIEGLAGRKEPCSYSLNKEINVFFGVNGSGKTSLLKILHSAVSGDAAILLNVPFKRAMVHVYSKTHDIEFVRTLEKPAGAIPAARPRRRNVNPLAD